MGSTREVISSTGIAYLAGLARKAQKRETGSIESEGGSKRWLGGLGQNR